MTSKREKRGRTRRRRLGQYYTPEGIVNYIIQHTLGRAIQEDPNRFFGEFTVLDPACGDGAFLIGTLQFLAEKTKELDKKLQPNILRSIVDSVHGIDVDPKAIRLCRKKLQETSKQLLGFPRDFSQHILLGNSLIQDDQVARKIFENNLTSINPVVWYRVYPWVMRDAGFDVVVGNPPFIGNKSMDALEKEYIRARYRTVHQQFDILVPFIELGLQLLRPGGRLGFIISNKVLAADYGVNLRRMLINNYVIEQMIDLSHLDLFEKAATYPHIIILRKPRNPTEVKNNTILLPTTPNQPEDLAQQPEPGVTIPQHYYNILPNCILTPALTPQKFEILQKLQKNTTPLGESCTIRCGIAKTGFSKQLITKDQFQRLSSSKKKKTLHFLSAGDVKRYKIRKRKYLTYSKNLSSPEQWKNFRESKLIIAGMGKQLRVAFDQHRSALGRVYYITQSNSFYNPYFLLALLNSRLINAYFTLLFIATHLRSGYLRYNATYLEKIPIASPTQKQEDELADLAKYAHQNPKYLKKGLDQEIDQCIADLYVITLKDIDVLEG